MQISPPVFLCKPLLGIYIVLRFANVMFVAIFAWNGVYACVRGGFVVGTFVRFLKVKKKKNLRTQIYIYSSYDINININDIKYFS